MGPRYAADTSVSVERSKAQIEQLIVAYGADQYIAGWTDDATAAGPDSTSVVQFRAHGRLIRFVLPLPRRDAREVTHTETGRQRTKAQALKAWEQLCRARWRGLLLAIKAKLEAVETGLSTFEQEFLPHTVLPNGETVADWLLPQLEEGIAAGTMPVDLDDVPALGPRRGRGPLALGPGT